VSSTPCGDCGTCRAISDNRFVDLLEVDAASRTKVEDTRELLENVSYVPSHGRFKVYLIDEVHMLSTHSFNALLKTLEEPPAHVVFILATTDPQKLLPTVLSRCLQFHLRDLSPNVLESHLEYVLNEENLSFEKDALWHLAKAGRGSVRDSLTLLDQAIAHGAGSVVTDNVVEMLGTQGLSEIPMLLAEIARGEASEAITRINKLSSESPDWMALVSGMQEMLHQIAIAQVADRGIDHLSPSEKKAVRDLANFMSPEFIQLAYQFSLTGYRDLPLAFDGRSAFEMLVLRMIAFRPAKAGEMIGTPQLTQADSDSDQKAEPEPEPSNSDNVVQKKMMNLTSSNQQSTSIDEIPIPEFNIEESPTLLTNHRSEIASSESNSDHTISELSSMMSSTTENISEVDVSTDDSVEQSEDQPRLSLTPESWIVETHLLDLQGMTASLVNQTVLVSANKDEVVLASNAHTERLLNELHRRRISEAFSKHIGHAPKIVVEIRETLGETPESYRARIKIERLELAKRQFEEDSFVRALTERFNASIPSETIQPKDGDNHV
jgi:DNA polymerase-3 subunit gamma/tau